MIETRLKQRDLDSREMNLSTEAVSLRESLVLRHLAIFTESFSIIYRTLIRQLLSILTNWLVPVGSEIKYDSFRWYLKVKGVANDIEKAQKDDDNTPNC